MELLLAKRRELLLAKRRELLLMLDIIECDTSTRTETMCRQVEADKVSVMECAEDLRDRCSKEFRFGSTEPINDGPVDTSISHTTKRSQDNKFSKQEEAFDNSKDHCTQAILSSKTTELLYDGSQSHPGDFHFLPNPLHIVEKIRKYVCEIPAEVWIAEGDPDWKKFDLTLMICLIQYLTSILQPQNGFDTLPLETETSLDADLARIKYYRNCVAHHDGSKIDTSYFDICRTQVADALGRLGGRTLKQQCEELKVKSLDQSNKEILLEVKIAATETTYIKESINVMSTKLTTLKKAHEDTVPWNIRNENSYMYIPIVEELLEIPGNLIILQADFKFIEYVCEKNRLEAPYLCTYIPNSILIPVIEKWNMLIALHRAGSLVKFLKPIELSLILRSLSRIDTEVSDHKFAEDFWLCQLGRKFDWEYQPVRFYQPRRLLKHLCFPGIDLIYVPKINMDYVYELCIANQLFSPYAIDALGLESDIQKLFLKLLSNNQMQCVLDIILLMIRITSRQTDDWIYMTAYQTLRVKDENILTSILPRISSRKNLWNHFDFDKNDKKYENMKLNTYSGFMPSIGFKPAIESKVPIQMCMKECIQLIPEMRPDVILFQCIVLQNLSYSFVTQSKQTDVGFELPKKDSDRSSCCGEIWKKTKMNPEELFFLLLFSFFPFLIVSGKRGKQDFANGERNDGKQDCKTNLFYLESLLTHNQKKSQYLQKNTGDKSPAQTTNEIPPCNDHTEEGSTLSVVDTFRNKCGKYTVYTYCPCEDNKFTYEVCDLKDEVLLNVDDFDLDILSDDECFDDREEETHLLQNIDGKWHCVTDSGIVEYEQKLKKECAVTENITDVESDEDIINSDEISGGYDLSRSSHEEDHDNRKGIYENEVVYCKQAVKSPQVYKVFDSENSLFYRRNEKEGESTDFESKDQFYIKEGFRKHEYTSSCLESYSLQNSFVITDHNKIKTPRIAYKPASSDWKQNDDSGFFSIAKSKYDNNSDEIAVEKEKFEKDNKRNLLYGIINHREHQYPQHVTVFPVSKQSKKQQKSNDGRPRQGHILNEIEIDSYPVETLNRGHENISGARSKESYDQSDGPVSKGLENISSTQESNAGAVYTEATNATSSGASVTELSAVSARTANALLLEAQNNPAFSANSLGSYFRERTTGKEFTSDQCMCYEWLRLRSFEDFPVTVPVSTIVLANEGFLYSGVGDRVKCFSCGTEYQHFKFKDNPRVIHRERSPRCRMVQGIESTNIPIRSQDQHRPIVVNGYAELDRAENIDVQNNVADSQNQLSQTNIVQTALRNTGANATSQPDTLLQPSLVTTDQAASLVRRDNTGTRQSTNWQDRPAHVAVGGGDRAEELGITIERPKYPAYAQLNVRISTYQGWPGYLDQTPRDMSLAGFFYAGYNDYCRCFFCGGGLRNWDAGDDPWVEHARWFPKCAFVRQNRGHRFVEIIVKRQAEMQASGNTSGSAKIQTAVTTQTTAGTQNQPQPTQVPTTNTQQSAIARSNKDPAIESVKEIGYSYEIIQRAISIIKQGNPGKENIEATEILEVIFTIADDDTPTNTAVSSENTQISMQTESRNRSTAQPAFKPSSSQQPTTTQASNGSQSANVPQNSMSSMPSLSVNSLENKSGATGTIERTEAEASGKSKEISENEIRSLQEENNQLKEQVLCKICMDKNVSIAFLPCGHLACCIDCAPAMRKCPMCRVFIKGTVKTYLA